MKKRCKDISDEFENFIKGQNSETINKIENDILEECKRKNEDTNKDFFEEKLKQYRLFKSSKSNSKNKEWKNILNLRTHSKKVKKRGRKSKKIVKTIENNNIQIKIPQNSSNTNNSFLNENIDKVVKFFSKI